MNLHNGTWLSWTNKLKWNELNIIFSSFAFNMVNVFIEIWIRFGLIESNSIQYKLIELKPSQIGFSWILFIIWLNWIEPNYENSIMKRHMLICIFIIM
jgi:hypothetical protein